MLLCDLLHACCNVTQSTARPCATSFGTRSFPVPLAPLQLPHHVDIALPHLCTYSRWIRQLSTPHAVATCQGRESYYQTVLTPTRNNYKNSLPPRAATRSGQQQQIVHPWYAPHTTPFSPQKWRHSSLPPPCLSPRNVFSSVSMVAACCRRYRMGMSVRDLHQPREALGCRCDHRCSCWSCRWTRRTRHGRTCGGRDPRRGARCGASGCRDKW